MKYWVWTGAVALLLAGCGGDTGAPQPTVTLSASQAKVQLGSSASLSWTATNAASCTASGAWSGTQATSGTSSQAPAIAGVSTYTLTCSGDGGSATQSVTLTVPLPVLASSYENKAAAAEALGPQPLPAEVRGGNAVAFADFYQDGSYSMVTHSLEYDPHNSAIANRPGRIHFWQKVGGTWTDRTSSLLADNAGCLHPRKASVADFNGDGPPDVFFACHGSDVPPFPGEPPFVLLSQPDGRYAKAAVPVNCFCHSASAADVTGDGHADVVVTGDSAAHQPFFLVNRGDGSFTQDLGRLPADVQYKPIFTAELIDFNGTGRYDLFLGGHEQDPNGNWPATILPNDGAGRFATTARLVLPSAPGYGFPTDIVFTAGAIYLSRTVDASTDFYGAAAIQKISYPSLVGQTLFERQDPWPTGTSWINWIISSGGKISTLDSTYGVSLAP